MQNNISFQARARIDIISAADLNKIKRQQPLLKTAYESNAVEGKVQFNNDAATDFIHTCVAAVSMSFKEIVHFYSQLTVEDKFFPTAKNWIAKTIKPSSDGIIIGGTANNPKSKMLQEEFINSVNGNKDKNIIVLLGQKSGNNGTYRSSSIVVREMEENGEKYNNYLINLQKERYNTKTGQEIGTEDVLTPDEVKNFFEKIFIPNDHKNEVYINKKKVDLNEINTFTPWLN